ncbi:AAC(3) family N-acetyltransferase [Viridibacillus sp. YIM B01967]|uniref:Aminoglycoside N(3)-acetyltransferase n=1 Tax=Viridibacillus soli TaxID=2798301 RepID=A0ABS1HB16_9BACL|nr:AAC(3) family N-acetyltransferase [Viridibacillus soli]MBK3496642.1 AAC(3) family N-acetyltransferase [Viridibacillus soli]
MTEFDVIQKTNVFQSKDTLKVQLQELGINIGDSIIVHSSLSKMGWIAGAEQAVIEALLETVTITGTIVMPAQSAANSEPSYWALPPAPEPWHQAIRDSLPAYDPHLSPLRGMGKIAECFLRHPATIRSAHPAHSFMAWGLNAEEWMREHPIESSFGLASPLGKMMQHDMKILFIGVDYDSCTALHLSEYLADVQNKSPQGAAMMVDGRRQWVTFNMLDVDSDRFPEIGNAFEKDHSEHLYYGKLGQASARVITMKPLIEFGTAWLNANPATPEK